MSAYVVDTNVPIAANGRDTPADDECQLRCIEMLEDICDQRIIVLDDRDYIFGEYRAHLSFSGVPGVGDKFFKHIVNHMYGGARVCLVSITSSDDERRGFEELPRNDLDPSDRKFLAAAVVGRAVILNATDSDWSEQAALTERLGVPVEHLCRITGRRRRRSRVRAASC